MGRQSTSGFDPAGSSCVKQLDPSSLPIRFAAHDARADGNTRQIELHRERVVLRRAVAGMRMAVNVNVRDFLGIATRDADDARMLMLVHRDPSLSIPLGVSNDNDEIAMASAAWSAIFALPELPAEPKRMPAQRRRRRNAISARRPKFLMRRRVGRSLDLARIHHGEREIIARD